MSEHRKIKTSYEVWKSIKDEHKDLVVFSSYSAPDGDMYGDPEECVMKTEYGFDGFDYPLIGAKTVWDKNYEEPHKRDNEVHIYWLCIGIDGDK